ncbi:MAG TPA: hypothetical protein VG711_00055 [Phycisphaerales bacterium]|nr:hypothetical protein [Phycisphaerales bacterium]
MLVTIRNILFDSKLGTAENSAWFTCFVDDRDHWLVPLNPLDQTSANVR